MNYPDPRLSDFSEEQLRQLFSLVMSGQSELRRDIKSYNISPELARMFADKIARYETELRSLDEIMIQLAGAIANKVEELKVQSN